MTSQISPLTKNAVAYTWRQLAVRAGITGGDPEGTGFEQLGISVTYGDSGSLKGNVSGIIVVPCADTAWDSLIKQRDSVKWLPTNSVLPYKGSFNFTDSVPVLFWGHGYEDGRKPFVERQPDGSLIFYADIIATTFFMLSRWEETVVSTRDQHDRFPATASTAYKNGFLGRPIVDEYALILRQWLQVLQPQWKAQPRDFSIKLSHDIDHIRRFDRPFQVVRAIGNDILIKRSLRDAWNTGFRTIIETIQPEQAAYYRRIYEIARLAVQKRQLDSAFYFMAADPGPYANTYNPDTPLVKKCIADLLEQGIEVGLHAGYDTFNDAKKLAAEKSRLDKVFGDSEYGGRQHFLRFKVPNTWRLWEQINLQYDSTMGYPEQEGFRCGTCHPFNPFDIDQDRQLDLIELPLIVMDVTLRQYRNLTPEQGRERILELADLCRGVEGTFTLLWHNSSFDWEWVEWGNMFLKLVATDEQFA